MWTEVSWKGLPVTAIQYCIHKILDSFIHWKIGSLIYFVELHQFPPPLVHLGPQDHPGLLVQLVVPEEMDLQDHRDPQVHPDRDCLDLLDHLDHLDPQDFKVDLDLQAQMEHQVVKGQLAHLDQLEDLEGLVVLDHLVIEVSLAALEVLVPQDYLVKEAFLDLQVPLVALVLPEA